MLFVNYKLEIFRKIINSTENWGKTSFLDMTKNYIFSYKEIVKNCTLSPSPKFLQVLEEKFFFWNYDISICNLQEKYNQI